MLVIYNVIRERKRGSDEGRVIESFNTSQEAEEFARQCAENDKSNEYNYFVAVVRDATK